MTIVQARPADDGMRENNVVKSGTDIVNNLPDDMGIDDDDAIDKLFNSLVEDVKGEIKGLEIIEDLTVFDDPITKPEECIVPIVLSKLDVEFADSMARNVVSENALMVIMEDFVTILEKKQLNWSLVDKIKDLKETAMKKDKILAIQKYEIIASELEKYPSNETKSMVMAFLYVFYEIFFSRIDL